MIEPFASIVKSRGAITSYKGFYNAPYAEREIKEKIFESYHNGINTVFTLEKVKPHLFEGMKFIDATDVFAISNYFQNKQPKNIIGITGSYGKGSTAHLFSQFLNDSYFINDSLCGHSNICDFTTSRYSQDVENNLDNPIGLYSNLSKMCDLGINNYIFEAFYDKLAQGVYEALNINLSAITNITVNHLNKCSKLQYYTYYKQRLFEITKGVKIFNAKCPYCLNMSEMYKDAVFYNKPPYYYDQEYLYLDQVKIERVSLPLSLNLYIDNLLLAIVMAVHSNIPMSTIINRINILQNMKYRFEKIPHDQFNIYCDVCWSPETLISILRYMKKNVTGRILCVYGMYQALPDWRKKLDLKTLKELADVSVICPRTERKHFPDDFSIDHKFFHKRRDAAAFIFDQAKPEDVILFLGAEPRRDNNFF